MDHLDKHARSWNMSRIRSRNTKPEIIVRRILHRLGYRFRLHSRGLPGTPDIVLAKHRTAIFVNGCFWHRHEGCSRCTMPGTRVEYWKAKFARNVANDKVNIQALTNLGWTPIVIWECETRDIQTLETRIAAVFHPTVPEGTIA